MVDTAQENIMSNVATMPPRVNGILETSLYVESPARSAEFYRRVFGFEPLEPGEPLNDETRLCPMRAGDRSVLLLFKKGATPDTDANGVADKHNPCHSILPSSASILHPPIRGDDLHTLFPAATKSTPYRVDITPCQILATSLDD
jgi:catechol 2,3-dioxygenase-like lactoylglutathione lyase family enzyme